MKLLWAPIVDAVYSSKFGRRKSWLIPTQFLIGMFINCTNSKLEKNASFKSSIFIGICMLLISMNVDSWLGEEDGSRAPNIKLLTIVFFISNFLAATQDIAVDGWALTMLHR